MAEKERKEYQSSYSQWFMTSEDIAGYWNKIGCPISNKKNGNKNGEKGTWKPYDISRVFLQILNKWNLTECEPWYRSHRMFSISEKIQDIQWAGAVIEYAICDYNDIDKKKNAISSSAAIWKKETEKLCRDVEKMIEDNESSDSKDKGIFIFNRAAFFTKDSEGNEEYNPKNFFNEIYRIYKEEKIMTIEDIRAVVIMLMGLLPNFPDREISKLANEEEQRLSENKKDEHKHSERALQMEMLDLIIASSIPDEAKREFAERKLYFGFFEKGFHWKISQKNRALNTKGHVKGSTVYRNTVIVLKRMVDKYKFYFESVQTVRKIENIAKMEKPEFPRMTVDEITKEYAKYKPEAEKGKDIIKYFDMQDNDELERANDAISECIRDIKETISKCNAICQLDKEIIIRNFINELFYAWKRQSYLGDYYFKTAGKDGLSEEDLRRYEKAAYHCAKALNWRERRNLEGI